MAIPKIPQLPIDIGALLDAGNIFSKQSERELYLTVMLDTSIQQELAEYAKQALYPDTSSVHLHIEPFSHTAPRLNTMSDLCLIFAGKSQVVGEIVSQATKHNLAIAVITLDGDELAAIAKTVGHVVPKEVIIAPKSEMAKDDNALEHLFEDLGGWIVDRCPETRLAFGRAFGFIRVPLARELSRATAFQNGAIGAAVFIPGADMPLMTLNQAKMLLQIAAAFGFSLGRERLKELVVVLLSALGFRAISRTLAGYVPLMGWAIKGGMGYSSTLALGYAATEYFANGGELAGLSDYLRKQISAQLTKRKARRKDSSTPSAVLNIKKLEVGDNMRIGEPN